MSTERIPRLRANFLANIFLLSVAQPIDLLGTKGMILIHGLDAEANKVAQWMFIHAPEWVDLMKTLVLPASIIFIGMLVSTKIVDTGNRSIPYHALCWSLRAINGYYIYNLAVIGIANVYRG